LYAVVPYLLQFIEELTNWYVRRSRRRFWAEDKKDKQDGYNTLYHILLEFSKALAPFLPFVTEEIYQNLKTLQPDLPESVHLCDYPQSDEVLADAGLEKAMSLIQQTVALGRSLRSSLKIRTRQPLQSITVVTRNEQDAEVLRSYGAHIKDELNVKEVFFSSDEASLVELVIKPNFPKLGPIFGKQMGQVSKKLASLTETEIASLESGGTIAVLEEELDASCIDIRRKAKDESVALETAQGVTVFFDTELSESLVEEGQAREFVNRVQRMRKEADFHVSDRINVVYSTESALKKALVSFAEYIQDETLAVKLTHGPAVGELIETHEIDGHQLTIGVERT